MVCKISLGKKKKKRNETQIKKKIKCYFLRNFIILEASGYL